MTCDRILVIEDEADIRETIKDILELEGFSVETAENGQVGLEKLHSSDRPCLILLDLMMPVMNGWQFLDEVRQQDILATIPIVVVSAAADVTDVKRQYGCDIMKKPASIDALMEIARSYCNKT